MEIAGVDVGGTFTDLILHDAVSGEVRIAKVPTTPENQAFGVLAALQSAGVPLDELEAVIHGTTTTTNALLERKLAPVGLITTRGFRDVLELGRRTRPSPYGMTGSFVPLIARERRLEVPECISAEGEVLTPLDEDAVRAAVLINGMSRNAPEVAVRIDRVVRRQSAGEYRLCIGAVASFKNWNRRLERPG